MPIYEYECETCGHRVELIQKYSDAPLAECPKCHGAVKKLIAAPALQFKGSGWYITDYSSKGKEGKEKSDEPADKKSGDSKPASAPAAATPTPAPEKKSDGGGAAPPPSKPEGTGAA